MDITEGFIENNNDEEFDDLGFDEEDLYFLDEKDMNSKNSNKGNAKKEVQTSGAIFEKLLVLSENRNNLNEILNNEKDLEQQRINDLKDIINELNFSIEQTVLKKQIEISNDILSIKKRIDNISLRLEKLELDIELNKKQYFEQIEIEKQIIHAI